MVEIIPAILTDSSVKFKDLALRIEPYASRVHIDIADGVFVPNKTINGYDELRGFESALKFDVHLMVQRPQDVIREWFSTHADRFFIHAESDVNLNVIIEDIHKNERKVGLVLNPETEVDKIKEFIGKIDYIQFMTVHPGFQGGEFVEGVINIISDFRKAYPDIVIIADGGITPETAPKLKMAGVSIVVVGSYIIKSDNFGEAIEKLRSSL
ncbi:MAG: ribulose-phosphate 3-epimerase [Candidatus Yanofskybacteria bacterium]|nr:ribulose-phosphate 3-epimerase [Candidatus Yanofskybacteria bacterium]